MALKKINYHGSSKVIIRLCEMVNQLIDGGGGGSKHTIINASGTSMSDRTGLQFTGATVTDDSANDKTVVAIPTNLSDFTNDSGFITNTVNNLTNYYLKSETYTKTEVQNLIGQISTLNILVVQTLPTQDISTTTIYLVPKATAETQDIYDEYIYVNNAWEHIGSTEVDLTNYYTKSETDALLADKVDKVTGKQLSTEDFTSALKSKLEGIEAGAQANVQADWNQTDNTADDYIKNKPTLGNMVGIDYDPNTLGVQTEWNTTTLFAKGVKNASYQNNTLELEITNPQGSIQPSTVISVDIPEDQIQSDWNQSDTTAKDYIKNKPTIPSGSGGHVIENTSGTDLPQEDNLQFVGVYSEDDSTNNRTKVNIVRDMTKAQMDALSSAEKEGFIHVTDEPDNPYNGDVSDAEIAFTEASNRANIESGEKVSTLFGKIKKWFSDLKAVAFSGSYSDLTDKPNLATVATSGSYNDLSNKPNLATVATSGSYNDLSNKPTIPTNNNQLTNGAGYITSAGSCASATNSDKVDGSHAWEMQTLSAGGSTHGSSAWVMKCQHNVDGDSYFKIFVGDKSIGTKVDRASSANIYNSLKHWEGARSYSNGYSDFSIGSNILIIAVNGYANYGYNFCWARVAGYITWRIVAYTSSGASTATINTDIWYVTF